MENRVPEHMRGQNLSVEEYCTNLMSLARNGVRGISFTGGEPTLNPDLPVLVARAAAMFDQVELTTNGRKLLEMLPDLAPHLDLLKVSLDAVDPRLARAITRGTATELERAIASIRAGCAVGLRVAVNAVVMRSTAEQIDRVVGLARAVNSEGFPGTAYVSLLDLYYSEERRALWQQEFFPIEELEATFAARYGPGEAEDRFGCRFSWFDAGGVRVRFKDSQGVTRRAPKCQGCRHYCQEGIYGLKHSTEGWVTTCPTSDPSSGAQLVPSLPTDEVDRRLRPLLHDIQVASPDRRSFATLLAAHGLTLTTGNRLPHSVSGQSHGGSIGRS
jgi:molybdenum cofactor biosynthesis enzyme MoaA